jgi:hypothetical protein
MAAFTAVAAGVGLAVTAATTTNSFIQAGKQRRLQRQAEEDAAKAMEEARRKIDVNYYEALGIQKEPYELERQALVSAGAQAMEAGRESERGAAAVAGRLQMAQQEAQAGVRTAMGKELTDLEKMTAMEESRLRDIGAQLDLEEVAGAQEAAAQAYEAANKATSEGIQGVANFATQAVSAVPLYGKNIGAQKAALSQMTLSPEEFAKIGEVPQVGDIRPLSKGFQSNLDLEAVGNMTNAQYRNFIKSLNPTQRQLLFTNPQYTKAYDAYGFGPFR